MTTDLTIYDSQYPAIAAGDVAGVASVIAENMGDDGLTPFTLDRIKVPAGGGKFWELPGLETERAAQTLDCIVLHWHPIRTYWQKRPDDERRDEDNTPPDCKSDDGKVGVGAPGGECATCPLNEWDSGPSGRGKACSEKRRLYVLQPGSYLPDLLTLPPTSLQGWAEYKRRLSKSAVPYYGVITKISLEQQKGGSGDMYSRAVFSLGAVLSHEQTARVRVFRDSVIAMLATAADAPAWADAAAPSEAIPGHGNGFDAEAASVSPVAPPSIDVSDMVEQLCAAPTAEHLVTLGQRIATARGLDDVAMGLLRDAYTARMTALQQAAGAMPS